MRRDRSMVRVLGILGVLGTLGGLGGTGHAFDFEWIGKIEHEAEGLDASDVKRRRAAVTQLGRYDIHITKPYLMRALGDEDPRVRVEAARVLARHRVTEAEPVIVEWLEQGDAEIKSEAATILASYATPKAVAALIRSLGDPDDRVREHAVQALGQIATPAVVIPLVGRLEDDKSGVRQAAIEQLAKLGDDRAVIPLVGAFQDSNEKVRVAAIEAVGMLGDDSAVPSLLRLLDDRDEAIKSAAVGALGNLHVIAATDTLIAELGRGSDGYKSRVAYALGQLARAAAEGSPKDSSKDSSKDLQAADRAVRALVAALASRELRTAASEALRRAGPAAVPGLVAHLDGEIEGELTAAVGLLRDIGDPRATPALVLELERARLPAELVLSALETSGDERALMPILGLLDETDDALRLRALTSLRAVITDARAADILIGLLDDRNLEIRVLATEYLGLMHARSAVPRLVRFLEPGHEMRLRLAATDALGEIADPAAAAPLLDVLARGPHELHRSAANALIYIGDPGLFEKLATIARDGEVSSRSHAARALGGVFRDRQHPGLGPLLRELAERDVRAVALAAIEALGATRPASDADASDTRATLVRLLGADHHRRRAAIRALGDIGAPEARAPLLQVLGENDDRVSAEAAWALAKLGARPGDPAKAATDASRTAFALDEPLALALIAATRRRGWATAVNASAAMAQGARAEHADALVFMLDHRDRFVRLNAAMALGRIFAGRGASGADEPPDKTLDRARQRLVGLLGRDPSPLARVAAARALSRIGGDRDALEDAARDDADERVRAAARAALEGPFASPPRTEWRTFHVVRPRRADMPVRQEAYFTVAADGLAVAYYTDARGVISEERFPEGEYVLAPHGLRSRY